MHRLYNFAVGNGTTGSDNGNLISVSNCNDSTRSVSYDYDPLNRLAHAYTTTNTGGTSWGETYAIDAWGNLTATNSYTNRQNHGGLSTSALTNNQLTGFSYDAAGNMTANGTATYTYDGENRMTAMNGGSTYTYDGDGNRVKKAGTNAKLYWRAGGLDAIAESDLTGNFSEEYIFFGGKRIVRRDVSMTPQVVHYYYSDHLGSASLLTDSTGTSLQEQCDFYPFGGVAPSAPCTGDPNTYKFTGKERDGESGMDDFGARYYASYMGRFMIPDWAAKATSVPYASFGDPQSLNLYSYVRNHPTVTVDPSGHVKMSMEQVSGGTDAEVANYFEQSGGVNEEGASGNGKNSGGGKCGNNVNCVDVVAPAPPRVETLDSYFAAAFGHHGFPVSLFRFLKNLNPSAYRFLNREFVTGRLAQRHVYDAAHRAYSKSVDELLDLQTAEGRAAVAEDAKAAAQKILDSDAPEISDFLDNLETANGMTGREVLQGVLDGVEADGAAEGLLLGLL